MSVNLSVNGIREENPDFVLPLQNLIKCCESTLAQEPSGILPDLAKIFAEIAQYARQGIEYIQANPLTEEFALTKPDAHLKRNKYKHDFTKSLKVTSLYSRIETKLLPFLESKFEAYSGTIKELNHEYQVLWQDLKTWAEAAALLPTKDIIVPEVESHHTSQGTILLIDDDFDQLSEMQAWLKELGHTVEAYDNGEAALERIHDLDQPIDCIILDLHLNSKSAKNMDGTDLLQKIKEDYALRFIPVIMLSGMADLATMTKCIQLGADDFIEKPPKRDWLIARINSCNLKGQLRRNEQELHEQVRHNKDKSDDLLYQVFPYAIAEELRTGGNVQPRGYENVAVLFCDIVGFTSFCNGKKPHEVVNNLHQLFSAYDDLVQRMELEKIKTIGDCFMLTAGLLRRFKNPVLSCLECAVEMRAIAKKMEHPWEVRIGVHAGPVVAGMVGRQKSFDVWGDTVNTAARVQTAADEGEILVSVTAWSQVYRDCRGKSRGFPDLKGKSRIEVFQFNDFREVSLPGPNLTATPQRSKGLVGSSVNQG